MKWRTPRPLITGILLILGVPMKGQSSQPIVLHGRAEILRAGHLEYLSPEGHWKVDPTLPEFPMQQAAATFYQWDGAHAYALDYTHEPITLRAYEVVEGDDHRRSWSFRPPVQLPDHTYPFLVKDGWALCSHEVQTGKPHPPFEFQLVNLFTLEATTIGEFRLPEHGGTPFREALVEGDIYLVFASGKIQVLRDGARSLETLTSNFWDSVQGLPIPPADDADRSVLPQGLGVTTDGRILVPFYGTLPCDRGWAEAAFAKLPPERQAKLIRDKVWPLPEGPLPWRVMHTIFVAFDLTTHRQAFVPFDHCKQVLTYFPADGGWRLSLDIPRHSQYWMDAAGQVGLIPALDPPPPILQAPARQSTR